MRCLGALRGDSLAGRFARVGARGFAYTREEPRGAAPTWLLGTCATGGGSEYAGVQGGVSAGVRDK